MTSSVDEKKLSKRLRREVGRAIQDFQMIGEGDSVTLSGSIFGQPKRRCSLKRGMRSSTPSIEFIVDY